MPLVKNSTVLVLLIVALTACSNVTDPPTQTDATSSAAKAPDENAALDAIRKANEAQLTYFKINRRYALTYDELIEARLLSSEPTAAETGYDFRLRPAADAQTYRLYANPKTTTAKYFFTDETGVIRADTGKEATADSPEVP